MMRLNLTEDPLNRFALFRTTDREEYRNALFAQYGVSHADIPNAPDFRAWANYAELEHISLSFSGCSTRILLDFPEVDYARQQFAVTGNATTTTSGVTTEIGSGYACTTSLGRPMSIACDAGHERLTLRIKTATLEQKLAGLLGAKLRGPIEFAPATPLAAPATQGLAGLIVFLARQLDASAEQLPPLVLRELEQAIIVQFLSSNRHTYTPQLEGGVADAALREVRIAEEYIEAHWNEAISIERLVEATGASARTLFRAFQRARACSPMAFARTVRLRRARAMLRSGDPNISVTAIAYTCGFLSTGHFSRYYREAFGELPSETLTLHRETRPPAVQTSANEKRQPISGL